MKALRVTIVLLFVTTTLSQICISQKLMSRTHDFGITGGIWLSGDISISRFGVYREKDTGFLLRAFYDENISEKFAVGVYLNFSPISSPAMDEGATMFEFGGAFKPRFPVGDGKMMLIPGLNIGYRTYSSNAEALDGINALGINLSVALQFTSSASFVPFVEVGFLSQPAGGNTYSDITFAPIIYLGGGIAF